MKKAHAPFLRRLQSFRDETIRSRWDFAQGNPLPESFPSLATQVLKHIERDGLPGGPACLELRERLVKQGLDAWTLDDVDQVLARLNEVLTRAK